MAARNASRPEPKKARGRLFGRDARRAGSFAMVQPQRTASISSSALHKVGERRDERVSQADAAWQGPSFTYVDEIGELGYLVNLKANTIAMCDFVPEVFDPELNEWVEDEDPRVLRVMDAFVGPQGGTAELKRRAALHLAIAGESMLVGSDAAVSGDSFGLLWEFVSTEELVVRKGQKAVRRRDGSTAEEVGDDVYIARLWKAHPRFGDLSDCAMRRLLVVCKELTLLTQLVEAIAKTRLAAGILFIPDEMSFSSQDSESDDLETDDEGEEGMDPLTQELLEHLIAPVTDRASAASLVPLVLRGKAEDGEKIRLIDLARALDDWAQELRQEALERLLNGLDVPKDVMEKGALNHWTSWNVDADFLQKHVRPDGDLLADFVTYAYERPMLEEFEGMSEDETVLRRLRFDMGPITARDDEAASARVLHEIDPTIIKDDTLRRANGFGDEDKPDEDEIQQRRLWRLLEKNFASAGPVLGPLIKGMEAVDWEAIKPPPTPGPGEVIGPDGQIVPAPEEPIVDKTSGQEEPKPERPAEAAMSFDLLVERLQTDANAALENAYDRAGARLVTKCQKDVTLRDRVKAADKSRAMTLISDGELTAMRLSRQALFDGAWDRFSLRARDWVRLYLEAEGMAHLVADDRAALAVNDLCDSLNKLAVDNSHRGLPPAKNGMRVPREAVLRALDGQLVGAG